MRLIITTLALMLSGLSFADSFVLDYTKLQTLLEEDNPTLQKIEAGQLRSELAQKDFDTNFDTNFNAEFNYIDNREIKLAQFDGFTQQFNAVNLGVSKNLKSGLKIDFKTFAQKSSNAFLKDATRTGVSLGLSFDLYKNILGRVTKAQEKVFSIKKEKADLEKNINATSFKNQIKYIYWALVANAEANKITQQLLNAAKQQLAQAQSRFKSKVADRGEVARYQSQVASRSASLDSLRYQRNELVQKLKEYLPSISKKEVVIGEYDVIQATAKVISCTNKIDNFKQAPTELSPYQGIIKLLNEEEKNQEIVTKSHDKMDLGLFAEYTSTGKAFNHTDAFENLTDNGKPTYTVGVKLNIPFGDGKSKVAKVKNIVEKKVYKAQKTELASKLDAYHFQIKDSIQVLRNVLRKQKLNTKYLSESLKISTRKYNQARITVQQLVQEQEAFFQSNLSEIETNLKVMEMLLNYFNVFTNIDCQLNK